MKLDSLQLRKKMKGNHYFQDLSSICKKILRKCRTPETELNCTFLRWSLRNTIILTRFDQETDVTSEGMTKEYSSRAFVFKGNDGNTEDIQGRFFVMIRKEFARPTHILHATKHVIRKGQHRSLEIPKPFILSDRGDRFCCRHHVWIFCHQLI
jgi:hypothetical protein